MTTSIIIGATIAIIALLVFAFQLFRIWLDRQTKDDIPLNEFLVGCMNLYRMKLDSMYGLPANEWRKKAYEYLLKAIEFMEDRMEDYEKKLW